MRDPTIMLGFVPTYAAPVPPPRQRWLSLAEAAEALGVPVADVQRVLPRTKPRTGILPTGEPQVQVAAAELPKLAAALGVALP